MKTWTLGALLVLAGCSEWDFEKAKAARCNAAPSDPGCDAGSGDGGTGGGGGGGTGGGSAGGGTGGGGTGGGGTVDGGSDAGIDLALWSSCSPRATQFIRGSGRTSSTAIFWSADAGLLIQRYSADGPIAPTRVVETDEPTAAYQRGNELVIASDAQMLWLNASTFADLIPAQSFLHPITALNLYESPVDSGIAMTAAWGIDPVNGFIVVSGSTLTTNPSQAGTFSCTTSTAMYADDIVQGPTREGYLIGRYSGGSCGGSWPLPVTTPGRGFIARAGGLNSTLDFSADTTAPLVLGFGSDAGVVAAYRASSVVGGGLIVAQVPDTGPLMPRRVLLGNITPVEVVASSGIAEAFWIIGTTQPDAQLRLPNSDAGITAVGQDIFAAFVALDGGVQKLLVFGGPGNQTATSAWLFDAPDRLIISGNTEPGGTYCGDGGNTGFVVGFPR